MFKVFRIAAREYVATAVTKGFIIGALVVPGMMFALIPVVVILMTQATPPKVKGSVRIVDRSGEVIDSVREALTKESLAERRAEEKREAAEVSGAITGAFGVGGGNDATMDAVLDQALGEVPEFTTEAMDSAISDEDLEAKKQELKTPYSSQATDQLLAIAVIAPDAVHRAEGAESFGGYELFVRPKMDDRVNDSLRWALRRSIQDVRYAANGQTRENLNALITVQAKTREITEQGEKRSSEAIAAMLPLAFMILLVMSVMIGGQYLLTTTVEEKSSRVVEVLLSAVSPMQLMTGKIIGQMGVGATLLLIYTGLGVTGLLMFAKQYLDIGQLVYLLVFFVLAYFMIASLLAAVGSAVNDMREAQSLQTPVMLVVIIPYFLWMPISRDPNSTLATVLSFVPPASPFVMMMRVTSTDPPPFWQVAASIAVGAVGAYICVWLAAKIFRVGLLMFGKPPNLRTLIKWVRMA